MKSLALHTFVTVLSVVMALALYHHFVIRPALRVGVVDIAEVYRAKEAEFTKLLTASSSVKDREQAMEMAKKFAQRLPVALAELPQECGCLVVLKASLIGAPNSFDLTPALRRKVDAP
ncbi:MAG: hypothetical protein FWD67_04085 [Betaproteobacteria bacterium]|nr:hypothetical protein [Betaproteobacteria bacterium]